MNESGRDNIGKSKMCGLIWKESRYKLFIKRWGIVIIIEAGYQKLPATENWDNYIRITDHLYFFSDLLPYPDSQQLVAEEQICFCNGLKYVGDQILEALQNDSCLITLRSARFSDCCVQEEAFTACAMQWASEAFGFPMPKINVWFDSDQPPCGKYVFDFSSISYDPLKM